MNKLTKSVIIIASSFTLCGLVCMTAGTAMGGNLSVPGLKFEINGTKDNKSDREYDDRYYGNGGYYDNVPGTIPYGGGYGSDDFFGDELDEFFRSFGLGDSFGMGGDIFGDFFDSGYGKDQPDEQL